MNFNEQKTKIVATIGPASENYEVMKRIIEAGVSTIRVNFSHGNPETHKNKFETARAISKELDIPISLMLDTKGPEIRIGKMKNDLCYIAPKSTLSIKTDEESYKNLIGDEKTISISYRMDKDVKAGNQVLLDDGKLVTIVKEVKQMEVIVETVNGHNLKTNKRVNIPGVDFSIPFLSDKDKEDIKWGAGYKVDYIAASFVNSAKNVLEIRKILDENNGKHIQIISKIESQTAINNIDEIIQASDGIMIARGDLGLEIPYYDVPYYEKRIIRKCRLAGKEVIVATQMLDSMENVPLPTRAEVTDVYFAVEIGADATMLSGETASGKYPYEAVSTMSKIAKRAEKEYYTDPFYAHQIEKVANNPSSRMLIAYEVAKILEKGEYKFAVVLSHSGKLLKEISKYRPNSYIIGVVSDEKLVWSFGVTSSVFCERHSEAVRALIKYNHEAANTILEKYGAKKGDKFIVVDSLNITMHEY
ncbi:pyruvate kinase [Mycoplasma phocoeninasale]|uniref:Pyruvate kinase n=1 Tax=Mycoplasma phocoeninasale TaxID=2726117 RepID=A0A858U4U5_9MOLU|nr:pyruvate kinase [Mycoplasma phocoeninasale]MBN0970440.1 pyruvate kinase [Mycoplasma phocoeninasale]QJG66437.1 pyruvate kinase [Mycoplasma phocoeninasale]